MNLPREQYLKLAEHLNDTRPSLGEGISEKEYDELNDLIDKLIESIIII